MGSEKTFTVYKDLVCAKSKFFIAACSEHWIEGEEKKVKLPNVSPAVFQRYLSRVYSCDLEWVYPDNHEEADVWKLFEEASMLIDLYILGDSLDSLDDIDLRNRTMEVLVNSEERWLQDENRVTYIWNNTPSGTTLHRSHHCARRSWIDLRRFGSANFWQRHSINIRQKWYKKCSF